MYVLANVWSEFVCNYVYQMIFDLTIFITFANVLYSRSAKSYSFHYFLDVLTQLLQTYFFYYISRSGNFRISISIFPHHISGKRDYSLYMHVPIYLPGHVHFLCYCYKTASFGPILSGYIITIVVLNR